MTRIMQTAVVGLAAFVLCGCGSQQSEIALADVDLQIPDSLLIQSESWQRSETLTAEDQECLSRFFALHRELAGSPEMEGQPDVFHSAKLGRRFYWLRSSASGHEWTCVAFQKGKFSIDQGSGNPFNQLP